jgi:hypothetical protein
LPCNMVHKHVRIEPMIQLSRELCRHNGMVDQSLD